MVHFIVLFFIKGMLMFKNKYYRGREWDFVYKRVDDFIISNYIIMKIIDSKMTHKCILAHGSNNIIESF